MKTLWTACLLAFLSAPALAARGDLFYTDNKDGDKVRITKEAAIVQSGSVAEANSISSTTVNGSVTASGAATFNGDVTLGDAGSDAVAVNGDVTTGNAATLTFTPPSAYALHTSSTIPYVSVYEVIGSSGGAITLTGTPSLATSGVSAGAFVVLRSTVASVTLQDSGTLPSSGLALGASTRALGVDDAIGLLFNGTEWVELFFANN
jgi:hypothetical protein